MRMHAVKFEVLEWEKVPLDWKRLGRPRNWEKLGVRIGNVRVVWTSKSIIIHPGRLRGFDVDESLMLSGRIVVLLFRKILYSRSWKVFPDRLYSILATTFLRVAFTCGYYLAIWCS